ncbi:MAG: hypothetical protein QXP81_10810 [Nitrososphaerota archaeon]
MPNWKVGSETGGQLQLIFTSKEDIISFINSVVRPSAELLGLEIIVVEKRKEPAPGGLEVVRV